jgi:hypothetical protein
LSEDFGYCEICGKRITGDDFGFGDAVHKDGKIYCMDCAKRSAAETNEIPAQRQRPAQRPPSTRIAPAHRGARRAEKKKRTSSRLGKPSGHRRRPSTRSAPVGPYKTAQVQKMAVSAICPYCMEKLVITIVAFPADHTCQVCGKVMRILAPKSPR